MILHGCHVVSDASGTPETRDRDGTILHDGFIHTVRYVDLDGNERTKPFLMLAEAQAFCKALAIDKEKRSGETADASQPQNVSA